MRRDDATEAQVRAARPDVSTWLSANAGSGKTRVLTDRVARLLLEGVLPQHILCLTYTKAAASEMQNRLFKRLGEWAMRNDTGLRKELAMLGIDGAISSTTLHDARTLFARAIETPGGLKIQTIHSFCASLLRRFPLEAGVSPLFSEMEDRAATLLREETIEEMAEGKDAAFVRDVAQYFTGENLETLAGAVTKHRDGFTDTPSYEHICKNLGLPKGAGTGSIAESVFLGGEVSLLTDFVAILKTGGANDNKAAAKLETVTEPGFVQLQTLEDVFLTKSGASPFSAKIGSVPSKGLQKAHPEIVTKIHALMLRVENARQNRLSLLLADRTLALQAFGHRFLNLYAAKKQSRGWLDFDDLILRARALLRDPAVAEWVLYRLDGGIDHILVDEAQDTSPVQWQVIERLAQEFTSGSGARSDVARTIFVVGDKKQSIYSFQGADPAEFDRMKDDFAVRLESTDSPLQTLDLEYSFRSSDAILRLVDVCFDNRIQAGFPKDNLHRAFNSDMPGRVDLWPPIEQMGALEEGDWFDPIDRLSNTHHSVILAQRVAEMIKGLIDEKETIPAKQGDNGIYSQRLIQPGDFLILVQGRSALFHEIIRACKACGLPIAGADRLKVGAELAVRDLGALLSFLSTPEDSLSLATALRSPLFGWSEQDLYDLAHKRQDGHLWQALRKKQDSHPSTMGILNDLLGQTDFQRPYDLIERILTRHNGRKNMLARLGREAEDGINALLSQALAYERNAVPSLTGFLVWMETDELEIKRQMDNAGNRIRVMTVHGSKGLEAPIVILPDTAKRKSRNDAQIVEIEKQAVWVPPAAQSPKSVQLVKDKAAEAQAAERLRLLYVAMTRAEKWLIVAAAGDLGKDGKSWYDIVQRGMQNVGAVSHPFEDGDGLRYSHGDWSGPLEVEHEPHEIEHATLPAYFRQNAPAPIITTTALSPSNLGGAKALSGEAGLDEEVAKQRGTWIHCLLEHLPAHPIADWDRIAHTLLSLGNEDTAVPVQDLLNEVRRVLDNPDLGSLFGEGTLAEVSITAQIGKQRVHGQIDRLLVTDTHVLAVDFKTNAVVPESTGTTPLGILRQMGAYARALAEIYPNHNITTAILWTKTATLMTLPHDLVTDALQDTLLS